MTTKRTIDADKLHELLLTTCAKAFKPGQWEPVSDAIDAAFPLADPTHNLRPLPESEWPDWAKIGLGHFEVYDIGNELFLVRHKADNDWLVFDDADDGRRSPVWRPTPAAALEAAGLPVELLEGLNRPTPAHENPRVVAAAVEMVKEVEQYTSKRAKDREDWLAQFPAWVREITARGEQFDRFMPLRMVDGDAYCFNVADPDNDPHWIKEDGSRQRTYRLQKMAEKNNLPLYADGNVPLWGDVAGRWPNDEYPFTVVRIDGDRLYDTPTEHWHGPECHLIRRHPAIADLPGIVVENNLKVPGVNCPKPEYDPDDVAFKSNTPSIGDEWELIDAKVGGKVASIDGDYIVDEGGMRRRIADVRIVKQSDKPNTQSPDRSADRPAPKLRVGMWVESDEDDDRGVICGQVNADLFNCTFIHEHSKTYGLRDRHQLTPIPPPLIDNGDGTATMEGYGMFYLRKGMDHDLWVWNSTKSNGDGAAVLHGKWEPTKEAAAEDLWRRMEGIDR